MKVLVYLEGKSDQRAMEALFHNKIENLKEKNIELTFIGLDPIGSNKTFLVTKIPQRAADIVATDPESIVVAIPDLYPYDCGCQHRSPEELFAFMQTTFCQALGAFDSIPHNSRERFKVFCFKHDLEALVLAAHEKLSVFLPSTPQSWNTWRLPVEDQNNDEPPKRIVKKLFRECGIVYKESVDAHRILGAADCHTIAARCPQCFKPFVDYIETLA